MRNYQGITVNDVEDKRVRHKLAVIDYFLRDLSFGMGRIQNSQLPDGSGDPIIGDDEGFFFKLKGRPENQDAHGGTAPGGTLTLSSTLDPTKSFIYLGDAQQTVYDEVNERIGINEPSPDARLHITTPTPAQTAFFTSDDQIGLWSGRDTGGGVVATNIYTTIDDTSNSDYIIHDNLVGSKQYGGRFSGLVDPGVLGPFTLVMSLKETSGTNTARLNQFFFSDQSAADLYSQTDPAEFTGITNGFANYSKSITFAQPVVNWNTGFTLTFDYGFSGPDQIGTFQVGYVYLTLPGGAVIPLQKWEQPNTSNTLSFVVDGNTNTGLTFLGGRIAVSASAFALSSGAGAPAAGMIITAQDAIGTMHWASASGLRSLVEHVFHVNGPYRVGDEIDGAWIPKKDMTLSYVRLYRRVGGQSGSTDVTLTRNGTTTLSAPISIAFNAGASATADGTVSVTAVSAGDRMAPSAVAVDTGLPRDAGFSLVIGAY